MGELFWGDNLRVLRSRVAADSIDLIYLDPPFNSNQDYHELAGVKAAKTKRVFGDTWIFDAKTQADFRALTEKDQPLRDPLRALRILTGESAMLSYLTMMAPRLLELHRVLKSTGSLYLHCDPTASHYLKVLLDHIFGASCFRNEVIWRYRRWPSKSKQFQKMHDVLLYYSKSANGSHFFQTLYGFEELAPSTKKTFGTKKQVADFSSGHRKPGRRDEDTPGPPLSDVWEIGIVAPHGRERLGYPTQKPEALLTRILLASSREGDRVLDPFCGSGTTLISAERLRRNWIGIDLSSHSIELIQRRFLQAFGHTDQVCVVEEKAARGASAVAARPMP